MLRCGCGTWPPGGNGRRSGSDLTPFCLFSPPAISPDGKVLAALADARGDGITLWDTATGAELRRMSVPNGNLRSLAFSPDGKTLASSGQEIYLWEVATGKERFRLPGAAGCVVLSPDGWTLAAAAEGNAIRLWDRFVGREIVRFPGHRGWVTCLAFSADGRKLVSGSGDNSALIWDVGAQIQRAAPPLARLSAAELDGLWTDLADEDVVRAYRAQARLVAASQQTADFLHEKLRPVASADAGRIARLIADLDNEQNAVRKAAAQELALLDELAEPALRKLLDGRPSAAARAAAERLLARREGLKSPEKLQALRALEVLEQIGTPQAQRVLQKLAEGDSEARLTREAKAALQRLIKRSATAH